jgi:hypothetical protein
MNRAITSFDKFSLLEGKGELKKLAGLKPKEEISIPDAKRIGVKIAGMTGEDKKKYVGIVNFLGASCGIFNEIWKNYKRVRDTNKNK